MVVCMWKMGMRVCVVGGAGGRGEGCMFVCVCGDVLCKYGHASGSVCVCGGGEGEGGRCMLSDTG